jgi:hypothetical protein
MKFFSSSKPARLSQSELTDSHICYLKRKLEHHQAELDVISVEQRALSAFVNNHAPCALRYCELVKEHFIVSEKIAAFKSQLDSLLNQPTSDK